MNDETAIKLGRRNTAEQNQKVTERALWTSPEAKALRESVQRSHGIDMKDADKFPVMKDGFSFKKMREKALRENVSASAFAQLERAGVQTMVNSMYHTVEKTYDKWAHVIQSSRDTELYAPLQGLTFPGEIGPGQKYIESNIAGLDIKLKNRKFGEVFPVERELLEDDQTGQVQQQVSLMAEYAALIWEVYCYGKLASVSGMQYSNLSVPVSETKPSTEANYPWTTSAAPFVGGGFNRPTSFAALAQGKIQDGYIALLNQLNLLALKMTVDPSLIVTGPKFRFDLSVLLNSSYTPSGAQAAGVTGGAFAVNPLFQVLSQPIISRFIFDQNGSVNANSSAWYVMDGSKPWFIVQMREAASVTQENPESGASFDTDVIRWKLRVRGNADFIDPRFAWQGSDGSA